MRGYILTFDYQKNFILATPRFPQKFRIADRNFYACLVAYFFVFLGIAVATTYVCIGAITCTMRRRKLAILTEAAFA